MLSSSCSPSLKGDDDITGTDHGTSKIKAKAEAEAEEAEAEAEARTKRNPETNAKATAKTVKRALPRILKSVAEECGLQITSFSAGWVHVLSDRDGKRKETLNIIGGCMPINRQSSVAIARDKVAAYQIMAHHGVPCVPIELVSSPLLEYSGFNAVKRAREGTLPAVMEMLQQWNEHGLVLKPNGGHGGYSVLRARCQLELETAFLQLNRPPSRAYCVGPFVPIGPEYRCIMLHGEMRICFRKARPHIIGDGTLTVQQLLLELRSRTGKAPAGSTFLSPARLSSVPEQGERIQLDWKHNLTSGAIADIHISDAEKQHLEQLARRAMDAIGLDFASVDIVRLQQSGEGRTKRKRSDDDFAGFADAKGYLVLEVNSTVMMDGFLTQHPSQWKVARDMYLDVVRAALEKKSL